MKIVDWEFAPTGGGDVTGHNDPVTTTFKGDISYYLARESIQNILDARDPSKHGPVIAEFELKEWQAEKLLLNKTLRDVLTGCRDFNSNKKKDAFEFYRTALFKIDQNHFIPVLRISDYNTVGLTGDDNDGDYFQLMKAVGDSSKSGNKGGSFGLGKGAYYAASSFRTIYVSSMYGKDNYVFQGKARLSSYKDSKTSEMMQGNGCFGLPKQDPVRELTMIPHMFQRTDMGTDFYIVGFVDHKGDWRTQMMKSVLNHFWYTISKGHLEVRIHDKTVNSRNLELLLKEYFDETLPDKTKTPNPWPYYLAYTSSDHKVFTETLPVLGKVTLFVLMRENFPQQIVYMRQTGMMIQKKGSRSVNSFAAVFVCDDDEGNLILRKMENPEHNEWKKENATESAYAEKAEAAEKEIREFISNSLKALTDTETPSSSRIGQLEDYLFLPGDKDIGSTAAGYSGEPLDEISKAETGNLLSKTSDEVLNPVPNIRKVSPIKEKIITGVPGGELPNLIDFPGAGGNGGGGKPGLGSKKVVVLNNVKFRSFANRDSKGGITHVVILKGPKDKKCFIDIRVGTDDSFDTVDIADARDNNSHLLKVQNHIVDGISLDTSGSAKLFVKFTSEDKYSLNITAYENK